MLDPCASSLLSLPGKMMKIYTFTHILKIYRISIILKSRKLMKILTILRTCQIFLQGPEVLEGHQALASTFNIPRPSTLWYFPKSQFRLLLKQAHTYWEAFFLSLRPPQNANVPRLQICRLELCNQDTPEHDDAQHLCTPLFYAHHKSLLSRVGLLYD